LSPTAEFAFGRAVEQRLSDRIAKLSAQVRHRAADRETLSSGRFRTPDGPPDHTRAPLLSETTMPLAILS